MLTCILLIALSATPQITRTEADSLVGQLGNEQFVVRKNAYNKLKNNTNKDVVAALRQGKNNGDPEISGSCVFLLRDIREVLPTGVNNIDGFPAIWYMPNKLRFPDGYEQDLAIKYYEEEFFRWHEAEKSEQQHWLLIEIPDPNRFDPNCILPEKEKPVVDYSMYDIAVFATIIWIGDMLENGLVSKDEAIRILDEMKENSKPDKTYFVERPDQNFHIGDFAKWSYRRPDHVPFGCMLKKQVSTRNRTSERMLPGFDSSYDRHYGIPYLEDDNGELIIEYKKEE